MSFTKVDKLESILPMYMSKLQKGLTDT